MEEHPVQQAVKEDAHELVEEGEVNLVAAEDY